MKCKVADLYSILIAVSIRMFLFKDSCIYRVVLEFTLLILVRFFNF